MLTTKTILSRFSSPQDDEELNCDSAMPMIPIWRVPEGASGVSMSELRSLTGVSFGEEAQVRGLCLSVWSPERRCIVVTPSGYFSYCQAPCTLGYLYVL